MAWQAEPRAVRERTLNNSFGTLVGKTRGFTVRSLTFAASRGGRYLLESTMKNDDMRAHSGAATRGER